MVGYISEIYWFSKGVGEYLTDTCELFRCIKCLNLITGGEGGIHYGAFNYLRY